MLCRFGISILTLPVSIVGRPDVGLSRCAAWPPSRSQLVVRVEGLSITHEHKTDWHPPSTEWSVRGPWDRIADAALVAILEAHSSLSASLLDAKIKDGVGATMDSWERLGDHGTGVGAVEGWWQARGRP